MSIFFILLLLTIKLPYSLGINLFKCCEFPNQFNKTSKQCEKSKLQTSVNFLEFFKIPRILTMSAYGNNTLNWKFLTYNLSNNQNQQFCLDSDIQTISFSTENGQILSMLPEVNESLISRVNFTLEGYVKLNMDYYAPNEYCFNSLTNQTATIHVCSNSCTGFKINPCVKRCCEFGEVWDLSGPNIKCRPSGEKQWAPIFYDDPYTVHNGHLQPHFISDHPRNGWCSSGQVFVVSLKEYHKGEKSLFRLLNTGEIIRKQRAQTWTVMPKEFICIDGAEHFPGTNMTYYTGSPEDTIVIDCSPVQEENESIGLARAYGISMIFSCIFLSLIVLTYCLLWEKQNVHSWTILAYIISLFFTYILLAILHFAKDLGFLYKENYDGSPNSCQIIGMILHFFFISTFCWLTMINFDLWWTFRSLKPTNKQSKGLKRFLIYCCFGIGIPIVIVTTAIALDFSYRGDIESDIIIPLYGLDRCYMEIHKPILVYVYIPVGTLLSINFMFFIITIYTLYKIQQSTKFASNSSSKNSKQKDSLKLFMKLFVIMGITWIFEIISYFGSQGHSPVPWYWSIFDFINIFQAILIFIIFVCKRDTITSLGQKYPKLTSGIASCRRRFPKLGCCCPNLSHVNNSSRSNVTETSAVDNNEMMVYKGTRT